MSNTDFDNDFPVTSDYATWLANPDQYNYRANGYDAANPLPVQPQVTQPVASGDVPVSNTTVIDQLLGTNGVERYQTWPEKLIRSAVTAPADALAGDLPTDESMIPR